MKAILMALLLAAPVAAPPVPPVTAPPVAASPVTVAQRQAADGSHILVHEVVVDAPVAAVWSAISTAEGWRTWAAPVAWRPPGVADAIETSYSPDATPGGPATIRQEILARVPEVLIVFRTVKAPAGFPHFDTYSKVTSVLQIEPAGKGRTSVRLTGSGYADSDAGRRLLGFFEQGNSKSLGWLRSALGGRPVDWAKEAGGAK